MVYMLTGGRGLNEKWTGEREIMKGMSVCLIPFFFEELSGFELQ